MIFTQIIAVLNIFETDDKNRQERLKKQALRAAPEPAEGVAKKTEPTARTLKRGGDFPLPQNIMLKHLFCTVRLFFFIKQIIRVNRTMSSPYFCPNSFTLRAK